MLITILNLMLQESKYNFIKTTVGDGRDLSRFKEKEFDIVFSNSVIEHLKTYKDQERMAKEVRRVGERYFVQTPNYYFPIEPHFLFPFFQFLLISFRVFLLSHFDLGWYKKAVSHEQAVETANEIRLLKLREFKSLFPDADIYKEKLFGLTKSFIAYKS